MSHRATSEAIAIIPSRFTSRLSSFGKILVINVAIFVFLLLLLEGAVRVAVPAVQPIGEDARLYAERRYGTSHGYTPNARGLSEGAEFVIDEYGRRIVPGGTAPARERTILFVGDSVSVGFGVEAKSALPHVLERRLDTHRVINAAVTAHNARDYANVLAVLLPAIRPEGIIVGLCLNDFDPSWFVLASRPRRVNPADPVPSWLRYINDHVFDFNAVLRKHSRLYVWIKSLRFDNSARTFRYDRALYLRPNVEVQITEDLSRLKELARDHNAWIEIFVFPYEYQLRSPEQADLLPQQMIKAAANDAAMSIHDLHRPVADHLRASGETSKWLYLFSDSMHFSAAGHDVVAGLVHTRIAHRLDQGRR
jgi:lysophospholipase L1-like esterase